MESAHLQDMILQVNELTKNMLTVMTSCLKNTEDNRNKITDLMNQIKKMNLEVENAMSMKSLADPFYVSNK